MDRYVIERTLPGAGQLSTQELQDISAMSNDVLAEMSDDVAWVQSDVAWVQSYVTDDKLYCVYDATDPALIAEHAKRGGFPCDSVKPVSGMSTPESGR